MSAVHIKGKIVSQDTRKGISTRTQKPFEIITYYVVNSGGAPVALQPARDQSFKVGQDIDIPVRIAMFKDQITFVQVVR